MNDTRSGLNVRLFINLFLIKARLATVARRARTLTYCHRSTIPPARCLPSQTWPIARRQANRPELPSSSPQQMLLSLARRPQHQQQLIGGPHVLARWLSSPSSGAHVISRASAAAAPRPALKTLTPAKPCLCLASKMTYRLQNDQDHEYARAIEDLNSLQSNSQVLALAKYKQPETILPLFRRQLSLAGIEVDDLNRLNVIHVSGTKGKGSTCAFLEQILTMSDEIELKVGSYNSPHLVSVTERIRIEGKPIGRAMFCKHFRHVYHKLKLATEREALASMPSYFSFLTILAFHIFLEERIDCAIMEVGMGGEYDPTNVVERPLACAITTLDLDHTNILGKTIERIAWTKAGIMKPGVPLFTIAHQEEATKMIETRAREKRSQVYICKPLDHQHHQLDLGIKSPAQYVNASIACQLAAYFLAKLVQQKCKIDNLLERAPNTSQDPSKPIELETGLQNLPEFFQAGLASCQLPGRCQIVECPGVVYFLDGAHTRKSMENCLEWFTEASGSFDKTAQKFLMVNVIGERDKTEVLKPLSQFRAGFDHVMFSTNRIQSGAAELPVSETFVKIQDTNNEKGLENAKRNAEVWQDLLAQYADNNNQDCPDRTEISTHSSIMECVRLLEEHKVPQGGNDRPKPLHVLGTGSLHFVGAILETLGLRYPEKAERK